MAKKLILTVLVLFVVFGGGVQSWRLRGKVLPLFSKFTQVTTKSHPDELKRRKEMERLVQEAKEEAQSLLPHRCSVQMIAYNTGTIYRRDELRLDCSLFFKPTNNLPVIAEYVHREHSSSSSKS